MGSAINDLVSIVFPRTFLRWLQQEREAEGTASIGKPKTRNPGRPKTEQEIRDLVVRLARENEWGYTRILCELKKLGVRKICRSTVINILKENGLEPGPKRGEGTWDEFLTRHVETLWACDFFSKKVWTLSGFVEMFVLFFIQVGTRRVHLAGMTSNPDTEWMKQRARNTAMVFAEEKVAPRT